MNVRTIAIAACAALATTMPIAVSAFQSDGSLPMYPRAKMNAGISGMPASAIAQGVPLVLDTSDSVHLVDQWYRSNAHGCARTAASGGVKYRCPSGSIVIYRKGDTQIAFTPGF